MNAVNHRAGARTWFVGDAWVILVLPALRWLVAAWVALTVTPLVAGALAGPLATWVPGPRPGPDADAARSMARLDEAVLQHATQLVLHTARAPGQLDPQTAEDLLSSWPATAPPFRVPLEVAPRPAQGSASEVADPVHYARRASASLLLGVVALAVPALLGTVLLGALFGAWRAGRGWSSARVASGMVLLAVLSALLWAAVDPSLVYRRQAPWAVATEVLFVAGFAGIAVRAVVAGGLHAPRPDRFLDGLRGAPWWLAAARRGAVDTVRQVGPMLALFIGSATFVIARASYVTQMAGHDPSPAGAFLLAAMREAHRADGAVRFAILALTWAVAIWLLRRLVSELDRMLVPARGGTLR